MGFLERNATELWNNSEPISKEEPLTRIYYKTKLALVLFYVHIILSIWIIVVNGVTLTVFIKVRNLRKKRTFIIISLAVVDLFTGATPLLRQAINVAAGTSEPFTTCMVAMVIQIIPVWSSVLHLFTIALERYIAITKPLQYESIVTSSRLLWTIPINIGISSFIALIAIAWPREQFQETCLSMLWFPVAYNTIFMVLPMAAFLCLLVGLYSRILSIARSQVRAIANEALRCSNVGPNQVADDVQSRFKIREESRATRLFIMVCGSALLCYGPWWLGNVLLMSFPDNNGITYYYYLSLVLLYTNSGMNFVIYVAKNNAFRAGIKAVFCKSNDVSGRTGVTSTIGISNITHQNNNHSSPDGHMGS